MTGELAAHRADLAATIMAQCCKRHKVMDYTVPIEFRRFWIYFTQPELTIDIYFTQVENGIEMPKCLSLITLISFSVQHDGVDSCWSDTVHPAIVNDCLHLLQHQSQEKRSQGGIFTQRHAHVVNV